MANVLGQIAQPDDDTLAKLLATYQAPAVVSGSGPLGAIAQAKLGASTAQPTLPDIAASHGLQLQTQDPVSIPAQDIGALPAVEAPSNASFNSTTADNDLVAAKNKEAADTVKPYDYHAHTKLGNVVHVLGRIGNIAGDILDPEATSLVPHSDLWNAKRLAQDQAITQQKTENAQVAGKELDAVNNEQANRQQKDSQFEAETPERNARVAQSTAETAKATQETADLVSQNKPTDATSSAGLNKLWGTDVFHPGMTPQDITRTAEALKVTQEMQARKAEFDQRERDSNRNHQDAQANIAESRAERLQFHTEAENDKHTAAQTKANAPYQEVIDNVAEANDFAKMNTGYGDYGLVMKFVDATKPKTGFKFNQTESGQIYGARSIADRFKTAYESGKTGVLLSPTQRTQILQALEVPKNAAMKHLQSSGSNVSTTGGPGAPPPGATIVDLSK